jgi:5-oxoprolinase (ATP-hydrolysing) subunit B
MRLLAYGDTAVLVELDDSPTVLGLAKALAGEAGVVELVPAARTLLVRTGPGDVARVRERIGELGHGLRPGARAEGPQVVLPVNYDGADLAETAAEVGLEPDGLVRAHCSGEYVVAFCGFTPGFAYLTGLDPALHVPRHDEPRTRVPTGSVAIAGEFTGVYPRPSPGGWRLLGRTDATLWDLARTPPALLPPGTRVRFRPA